MSKNENKEDQITISKLGPYDVLCGRDKKCNNNAGNHQFRVLVNASLPRYMACTTKFERSKTISAISDELLNNPHCSIRFFRRVKGSDAQDGKKEDDDNTLLEQLDRKKSHEKIAHALRDYAVQHRKNQEKYERSMALQQQTMPQQNILFQEQVGGHEEHEHRVTPLIDNLTDQVRIAQEQVALAQYNDLSAMTPGNMVSLDNPSDFVGFDGYNHYAVPLESGHDKLSNLVTLDGAAGVGASGAYNENPSCFDGNNLQRGLISESNSRHLERLEGTIDGSLHRSKNLDICAEFSESENYDNFDPMALAPGNSLRHMEGVERTESNRSFGKTGSNRSFGNGRTESNRSVRTQNSLRHVDVFDKGPSTRSFRSRQQESIDEMSLLQTSMGTMSLGTSNMSYQGDSTLSLQTRPELMSEKSRMEMSFERPITVKGISKLTGMSSQGDSTFTLQTRPEMMSEKSRMEMSFDGPISSFDQSES